jgi:L-ascorbate metabolism protein UlaG (beta-lactamase superfamily)
VRANESMISLAPQAGMEVEYKDDSRFGGATSAKLQQNLRTLFQPVHKTLRRSGPEYVVRHGARLLKDLFASAGMQEISKGHRKIAKAILYPDPQAIAPEAVIFSSGEQGARLPVDRRSLPEVHDIVADLIMGVRHPSNGTAAFARSFCGFVANGAGVSPLAPGSDVIYLGHNTVAVRSSRTQVVVDPWFFPASGRYRADYQPITRQELGDVDCVAITHSHPDHFHPGSLLQFHRDTHIIVPRVPRESILSLQMADRLRELGFRRITELDWWSTVTVGDISISAAPFHGEQPTVEDQLHPEVRNHGNCYVIRSPRVSCAMVADCGRDRDGSVTRIALEGYRRWGAIDILFSGFRGWNLYPIQYFESSVRQYLLFVPDALYGVRQSIMNNIDEAVDTAEAWHAHYLVPYADGGAPWFSDIGLGPKFGPDGLDRDAEWTGFDALPERCLDALRKRSTPVPGVEVASSVNPLLLRPGDAVSFTKKKPTLLRSPRHRWPWDARASQAV